MKLSDLDNPNDWRTDEQKRGWLNFIEWVLGGDHPALKEQANAK